MVPLGAAEPLSAISHCQLRCLSAIKIPPPDQGRELLVIAKLPLENLFAFGDTKERGSYDLWRTASPNPARATQRRLRAQSPARRRTCDAKANSQASIAVSRPRTRCRSS